MNKYISMYLISIILFSSFYFVVNKGNQPAYYECTEGLDIDTTLFNYRKGEIYFYFDKDLKAKNLASKGFNWIEDNPKDYFTAYLINTTDTTFNVTRQDGSLIMIQEAMDEKGQWQPIEYWVYSGCGNSYFDPLELNPGKYVMIPIKEYHGNFKTKIRLKMKNDKKIIYSESFEGSIDKSQFEKETKSVHGILYHGPANYLDN
jgi:hypothetical protein